MRRLFFLLFLLIATNRGRSQIHLSGKSPTDSLEKIFLQSGSDSVRARTSFALADFWAAKDTLKAMKFLEDGAPYSMKERP